MTKIIILVQIALLLFTVNSIQLILKHNLPTCTIIISSFEPIKVEAKFPPINKKASGDKFKIILMNMQTNIIQSEQLVEDNSVFRKNFNIPTNIIYNICFEMVTNRDIPPNDVVFMGYSAEEHFQNKISKVQIPEQLANENNLKVMYEVGANMLQMNKVTSAHQQKERELQDKLVNLSLHKTSRIRSITLIECVVIIISGVYQVLALRRFLIQKNLY